MMKMCLMGFAQNVMRSSGVMPGFLLVILLIPRCLLHP